MTPTCSDMTPIVSHDINRVGVQSVGGLLSSEAGELPLHLLPAGPPLHQPPHHLRQHNHLEVKGQPVTLMRSKVNHGHPLSTLEEMLRLSTRVAAGDQGSSCCLPPNQPATQVGLALCIATRVLLAPRTHTHTRTYTCTFMYTYMYTCIIEQGIFLR